MCDLIATDTQLEDYIWWDFVGAWEEAVQLSDVRRVAASTTGETRTESWSRKTMRTTEKPTFFGRKQRRTESVAT